MINVDRLSFQDTVSPAMYGPSDQRTPAILGTVSQCTGSGDSGVHCLIWTLMLHMDTYVLHQRCRPEWSLTINASKMERSSVCRHADRVDEEWRMTRKLGSLLGEAEDVARRKQLANVAFRKLSTVWFRRSRISLPLRLRLYKSFVVPVLIYNMGTWGLTKAELDRLDAYHRHHLRQIVGIHWPHRISNTALYRRCRCHPISEDVKLARWRLFGHAHSEGVHERLCLPR